jgi:hypothetical protein
MEITPCFIITLEIVLLFLALYVDDIVITGEGCDDTLEKAQLKKSLSKELEVKDVGQLRYILGIKIAGSPRGIVLSQQKYVLDLLNDIDMLGFRPTSKPIEQNHKLCDQSGEPIDKEKYQRLVGLLIYLCHTRHDITYAVCGICMIQEVNIWTWFIES